MKRSLLLLVVLSLLLSVSFLSFASWSDYEGEYSDSAILFSTPEEYNQETGNQISGYEESPLLEKLVEEGKLPTLEERLPKEPAVLQPADAIGTYGGTLKRVWKGPSDKWGVRKLVGERFVTGGPDGKVYPNVAKGWDIQDDGRTYIFYLREGMRWSDGHPVTADDVLFWWDMKTDPDVDGPPNRAWTVGGELPKWEKVDDYTVKISFAETNATLLEFIASEGHARMVAPKHYMKKYWPKYSSEEEVQKLVDEAGYDSWQQLYDSKYQWPDKNPDRPVITAWIAANDPSSTHFILERNPYYWKVDNAGNQLPYIDEIVHEAVSDPEMITMRAMSGEVDFQGRHIRFADYPLLMENRDKGGYNVMALENPTGGSSVFLNVTLSDDPVKKELFANDKFRKALSLAVNRDEINDIYAFGQSVVRQAAFPKASPFYDEEWAEAYADYDIARANEMLDEIGLEKGSDGIRLLSDGRKLTINLMDSDGANVKSLELLKVYWEKIGVDLLIKTPERSLFETRLESGNYEALRWGFDTRDRPDIMGKGWAPDKNNKWAAPWGPGYSEWLNTDGASGEEPPAGVLRMNEILTTLPTIVDFDTRKELMQEVVDFHKEQILIIGISGPMPAPFIYNQDLGNVTKFPQTVLSRDVGLSFPPQLYFKK